MAFRVGQKVVCVRASTGIMAGEIDAVVGCVYTVRNTFSFAGMSGLHFEEIKNPKFICESGYHERFMVASRFRPVVERKTDISIFTRMLNSSKQGVDA